MMKITIISIGKLKESYWKEAEAEYLKRLSAFAKIDIIEHKEIGFSEKDNTESIKEKEAEIILNSIPESSYIIALDPQGKETTSEALSKKISDLEHTTSHLTFIIGGPLGIHESIFKKTNLKLSLSPLTFTHQMTRVILIEQTYRAYMIKTGKSYHH
ncbi:MAG TPA: 23S rRNA (pseudouridine(1915)-N(3))-methyltransferase RlmH [Candidatus Magasanikbacteria bacterium]|nr:23S rRNA (pseudouridine(1915)-N(3))-methyltransferase RlmH [Candidatus Magasanikbacteria bacterium]